MECKENKIYYIINWHHTNMRNLSKDRPAQKMITGNCHLCKYKRKIRASCRLCSKTIQLMSIKIHQELAAKAANNINNWKLEVIIGEHEFFFYPVN